MNQYRAFASPFAKVFLGGVFVYQVLYWTWLKLEMDETKVAKNGKSRKKKTSIDTLQTLHTHHFTEQVSVLEKEARELTQTQSKK